MSAPCDSLGPALRLEPGVAVPAFCEAWARSAALAELVTAFGGQIPGERSAADVLAWLDEFSVEWDYRQRKERNEADVPDFDGETATLVDRVTRALGLQDTLPPARAEYDHVLILGGLARGCLARPLHAASLMDLGVLSAGRVTALGAFRPINNAEHPLLDSLGLPGGETEFDVMESGVRWAFGVEHPSATEGGGRPGTDERWCLQSYKRADGVEIVVAAAPSPEPGRRANTADTYEWLASRGAFAPGESVLIVTTLHYRLYQLADAIRTFGVPHGLVLDAVGIAPGGVDARLAWEPSTGALLQETRSSIRALRRLQASALRS